MPERSSEGLPEALIDLQRRFLAVVTDRSATAGEARADGLVRDSRGVPGAERLALYARMYRDRLIDSLAEDFPKLHVIVGGARFRELAIAYLAAHPPWSYTLRDAGDRLPGFLAGQRSAPSWWAELAALEWARIEAFDAADDRPLVLEDLEKLAPEDYPALALAPVSSATLLVIAHTVDDVWSRIEEGSDPGPVETMARSVAVWRRDLVVFHRTLAADEADLLQLVFAGCSFAELCAGAAGRVGEEQAAARAAELLLGWSKAALLRAPARARPD